MKPILVLLIFFSGLLNYVSAQRYIRPISINRNFNLNTTRNFNLNTTRNLNNNLLKIPNNQNNLNNSYPGTNYNSYNSSNNDYTYTPEPKMSKAYARQVVNKAYLSKDVIKEIHNKCVKNNKD